MNLTAKAASRLSTYLTADEARRLLPELTIAALAGDTLDDAVARTWTDANEWRRLTDWASQRTLAAAGVGGRAHSGGVSPPTRDDVTRHAIAAAIRECQAAL